MSEILLYKSANGAVKLEVLIQDETIWLSQKQMAGLFGVDSGTISYHLKNIYQSGELKKDSTTEKISVVQKEGSREVKRGVLFYNLDAIISVGYRVNSKEATEFRIWATQVLKEYIIKGFAMDDERLKNPQQPFGKDYFDEKLDAFLSINDREILQNSGTITAKLANTLALKEFEKFKETQEQNYVSDFDTFVAKIEAKR